jgi:hypothetical protein
VVGLKAGSVHAKGQQQQQKQQPSPKPSPKTVRASVVQQSPENEGSILVPSQLETCQSQDVALQPARPASSRGSQSARSTALSARNATPCNVDNRLNSSSSSGSRPAAHRLVPLLNLSRAQLAKGPLPALKGVCEPLPLTRTQAARDAELCLDHSTNRAIVLHKDAPMQDSRCYHYKAMGSKVGASRLEGDMQATDQLPHLVLLRASAVVVTAQGCTCCSTCLAAHNLADGLHIP